ncbi:MAG TPA: hypothetical protein VME68_15300 [Acidobacteriaceae bacterium]|nr:hypothetical protein [Acidobacteriaceae bacterium]
MKYSTFEQAASEASAGVREIDAEINRLMAKRDLLETLANQLLTVLPQLAEAAPRLTSGESQVATMPDPSAAQQTTYPNETAEPHSYSSQSQEWSGAPAESPAPETEPAAAEQSSYMDSLTPSKPYSLRNGGWPASAPVDQRGLRQLI